MAGDKLFAKLGRECPTGTILFRDGEEGQSMFVLQSGRVRLVKELRGRVKVLGTVGPGEFFGEMAILNGRPRSATAEVVETCKLLEIDAKTFATMVTSNAELAVRLIRRLAERLAEANSLAEILLHRDPRARIILGLVRAAEYRGHYAPDGVTVVDLEAEDLSAEVGVPLDDAKNVLARLERLRLIETSELGLRVPEVARLHEYLDFLKIREGAEGPR
jgi:CRP-like cAMP-binding protein